MEDREVEVIWYTHNATQRRHLHHFFLCQLLFSCLTFWVRSCAKDVVNLDRHPDKSSVTINGYPPSFLLVLLKRAISQASFSPRISSIISLLTSLGFIKYAGIIMQKKKWLKKATMGIVVSSVGSFSMVKRETKPHTPKNMQVFFSVLSCPRGQ